MGLKTGRLKEKGRTGSTRFALILSDCVIAGLRLLLVSQMAFLFRQSDARAFELLLHFGDFCRFYIGSGGLGELAE